MSIICTCGKASGPMCNGSTGCPFNSTYIKADPNSEWKQAPTTDTKLPADVMQQINYEAEAHYPPVMAHTHTDGPRTAYKKGATAYAIKWFAVFEENGKLAATIADKVEQLQEAQQELSGAKECLKLLTASYKELEEENKDNNKNRKEAMRLLFRLTSLVDAGHKPDEKFLTEIKTFLDGAK